MFHSKRVEIVRSFKGHSDKIIKVLFFPPNTIVSGSHDGKILVWDMLNGRCEQAIDEHKSSVYGLLKLTDCAFLSCSSDGSIVKWKHKKKAVDEALPFTFRKWKEFRYHKNVKVYDMCLLTQDDVFASSDALGYIYFCSNLENKVKFRHREESKYVTVLRSYHPHSHDPNRENIVIYNTKDLNRIKFFDYNKKKVVKVIEGHTSLVNDIKTYIDPMLQHDMMISTGHDHRVNIYDITRGKLVKQFQLVHNVKSLLLCGNGVMISGMDNGNIEAFHIGKKKNVFGTKLHNTHVCSMQWLDRNRLIFVSSGVHHIKICRIRSTDCESSSSDEEDEDETSSTGSSVNGGVKKKRKKKGEPRSLLDGLMIEEKIRMFEGIKSIFKQEFQKKNIALQERVLKRIELELVYREYIEM